ncbi:hypothetical protein [Herbinix luporum]|uniref:Putative membrane protein n=1 Tax=Herbinix luporum TaxID=1679721 RepID=A0A0K8J367_9FIRM|nr:hypothetical protein [Herbinix luporum]CUH91957.1 putative membrane protein [Herbinix luporum]
MKQVWRLVSVQLWAMLGSMFAIGEMRKKKTRVLYVGFTFFALIMSMVSFFYGYSMGLSLKQFNSIEIMPSLFMALTSMAVLFTTIYKVKGTLFGFEDYDMVMSLPISTGKIVASRIILLYSINLVFVLIVIIPMMVAYGILVRPSVGFYIFNVLTVFFIPLIPIIIATFFGTVITYISMGFRYSNIIYMVFTFIFLIGIMISPYILADSQQVLVELGKYLSKQINTIYPLAGLYFEAVINLDFWSLLIFIAISVIAFILFSLLVGKVFVKINTTIMTGRYKGNYKLGKLKSNKPLTALYRKELKRYFSSPVYVMNTGFGIAIMFIGAIALPFVNLNDLAAEMQMMGDLHDFVPIFITFCIATSCTTMASISMEGKNIWIVKSIPVSVITVFASKILVNLTILSPVIPATILIIITLKIPFIKGLLILLTAVSFSVFISMYGLMINLNFPNLQWSSETVVVKQSTASMISVFSGLGLLALQYFLWIYTGNYMVAALVFICILWLLNLVIYKILTGKGRKQFESL